MSSQREKQRLAEDLAVSRRELSEPSQDARQAFDLAHWGRYLAKSLRDHLYGWMSLAAIAGWVLSRLPTKKQKVYVALSAKGLQGRGRKPSWPGEENPGKGGPKLLSLARELLTPGGQGA